ncbi:FAS1-like dehydratase domain-containing protein [Rhodococcus koreensis]
MTTMITAEMKAAVGAEIQHKRSYPVSASDIRRWATAIYWPDQPPAQYLDSDEAALIAPEELNPFAWIVAESGTANDQTPAVSGNDPDATEMRMGIEGPGLRRQLNGGLEIEYGSPMRVGDEITSVRTLSGYREREGKLGSMLFTNFTDTWTNQRGELVKRSHMTLIRY